MVMGTNYYLEKEPCKYCGHKQEAYHIGKSSAGWVFGLHVEPENHIHDLDDVLKLCQSGKIVNEYDDVLTLQQLKDVIMVRSWEKRIHDDKWYKNEKDFLQKNHAVMGPNNLLRSKIDGEHCIAHGAGTWDLIIGEFS